GWKGDIVPGSTFMYGSSLMHVTLKPRASSRHPMDEAASPFPRLETTPPVTKMYLGICSLFALRLQTFVRRVRLVALALLLLIVVVTRLQVLLFLYRLDGLRVDHLVQRVHPGQRGGPRRPTRLRDAALVLVRRHRLRLPAQEREPDERADDDEHNESESYPVTHSSSQHRPPMLQTPRARARGLLLCQRRLRGKQPRPHGSRGRV